MICFEKKSSKSTIFSGNRRKTFNRNLPVKLHQMQGFSASGEKFVKQLIKGEHQEYMYMQLTK